MLAELAAAGIGAGASVWGAGKAADAQEEASKRAIALQYEQMRRASNLYRPYREAGEQALTDYQGNIGNQPTYENTLANLVNEQRRTLKDQQTAIEDLEQRVPVSYTHLTLPTILRV